MTNRKVLVHMVFCALLLTLSIASMFIAKEIAEQLQRTYDYGSYLGLHGLFWNLLGNQLNPMLFGYALSGLFFGVFVKKTEFTRHVSRVLQIFGYAMLAFLFFHLGYVFWIAQLSQGAGDLNFLIAMNPYYPILGGIMALAAFSVHQSLLQTESQQEGGIL